MQTSTGGFQPNEIRKSHPQVGALRHLPYALHDGLGPGGKVIGELPEQMPYQEWLHSDYKEKQTCQSCHMPRVKEPVPITTGVRRAARGHGAARLRGGEFLHAADAEPVSRRPGSGGPAAGA